MNPLFTGRALRYIVYGLLLFSAGAKATTISYIGAVAQTYTIPTTGVYQIIAYGAQGGAALDYGTQGGLGAEIGGEFTLSAGTILSIYVGQMGGAGFDTGGGG